MVQHGSGSVCCIATAPRRLDITHLNQFVTSVLGTFGLWGYYFFTWGWIDLYKQSPFGNFILIIQCYLCLILTFVWRSGTFKFQKGQKGKKKHWNILWVNAISQHWTRSSKCRYPFKFLSPKLGVSTSTPQVPVSCVLYMSHWLKWCCLPSMPSSCAQAY